MPRDIKSGQNNTLHLKIIILRPEAGHKESIKTQNSSVKNLGKKKCFTIVSKGEESILNMKWERSCICTESRVWEEDLNWYLEHLKAHFTQMKLPDTESSH